jgi:hypothetical protein
MKKEVFIAILSGLILGVIITFGIYTANRSLEQHKAKRAESSQNGPSPSPLMAEAKTLTITSPENNTLVNQSELNLSAIAWPEAVIAVITEKDEILTQADQEGIFTVKLNLIKGFNELTIIATDESGDTQTQNLIVTYSTAKIEADEKTSAIFSFPIAHAAEQTPSTPSTDFTKKIKERLQDTVKEGLENIKSEQTEKNSQPKKKAFVGQIESVSDSLITIKYKSQIYTAAVTDSTVFIKSRGHVKLTLDDIKPDDFVIAMGFAASNNDTLDSRRILVISAPSPPPVRQLLSGKIKEIDGSKITVNAKTLRITSKTDLKIAGVDSPSVEDLELDDYLFAIVVLDKNGDIDKVKKILVLPGKNNPASLTPTNATESGQATPSADEK